MRAALVLLVVAALGRAAAATDGAHPEMRAALREIETARRHLEEARHDYRGHRSTAVEELRRAADHVRRGLAEAEAAPREDEP